MRRFSSAMSFLSSVTSFQGATTGRTTSFIARLNRAGSSMKGSCPDSSNQTTCFEESDHFQGRCAVTFERSPIADS